MTRIAHLSDLHISAPLRARELRHATCKQLLGWLNWNIHRARKHDPARLRAAVREILRREVDSVIVTGDLCQLGHDREVEAVRPLLQPLMDAGIPTHLVSGNHDLYAGSGLLPSWCRLRADLAGGEGEGGTEAVRARRLSYDGGVVLLADMAVPTPAFRAWGEMDADTCSRIGAWLEEVHPEMPVLLAGHFPLRLRCGRALPSSAALRNADVVSGWIASHRIRGYLCGHVHKPYVHDLGHGCMQYCAGSVTGKGVVHVFSMEAGGLSVDVVHPDASGGV